MGIEDGDLNKHDMVSNPEETAAMIYQAEKRADENFDYDPS